jgi:hypothetical protein
MAVCTWLAAVEAEIQANLHHQKACLSALDEAERIQDAKEQCYYADFDHLRLLGYKGVCLQLLYSPENTSTLTFLTQAQQSLKEALALIDPALLGWQCGMHTDLAGTYARQGILEQAYLHATQALTLIPHIKSQTEVQRLRTLRRTLEPWKETQYVKDMDAQMAPLLVPGWYVGSA